MTTRVDEVQRILQRLELSLPEAAGGVQAVASRTPIDGSLLAHLPATSVADARAAIARAEQAFLAFRSVPAPLRGEGVRRLGELVRRFKPELGELVSLETGKIRSEGLGEVQEVIDICDFAVGLSRQLHGLTIASERPDHKLLETWHPLGVVGIISAFNFPAAVWAWNAALALVCGDPVVWKPSEKTPLTALVFHRLAVRALESAGLPGAALSQLVLGGPELGEELVRHPAVRLVSATGSTRMGRSVGEACARHFKRALLELGGNNAAIVCPSADLELAVRSIVFSAAGTAGQRCTSLRRLFVCREHHAAVVARLAQTFGRLPVGDPLAEGTLVGPLIDAGAGERMEAALRAARELGATVHHGERVAVPGLSGGCYLRPALVALESQAGPMLEETFAPILYVVPYDTLEEALLLQNGVVHGLSSAIFTRDLREAEQFLSARGSDCGIANVNLGTSGAEIGGAFGGEKETGGGRESGSDSWKGYMRRQTSTINYGSSLPLAQGVRFDV